MDIGAAVSLLRAGKRVTREGSPGMWVQLVENHMAAGAQPWLLLRDGGSLEIPWTPSQEDILALDWEEVG